jgi:hypothetical protein
MMSQAMLSQAMLSQAGVARISIDEDASAPGSACLQVPDGFEAPPTRNAVIRLGGNSEGVLCVRLASTTWPHSESPRNDSPTTRCLRRHPQRSIVGMRHRQRRRRRAAARPASASIIRLGAGMAPLFSPPRSLPGLVSVQYPHLSGRPWPVPLVRRVHVHVLP